MKIPLLRALRSPLALAALPALLLTSCGDDEITNPLFGSGCTSGSLRPGDDVTDAFNVNSCVVPYFWWAGNRVFYTSYRVTLEAGTAYRFHMRQIPNDDLVNNVDAVLTLWGKNASGGSEPLAVSDDQGDGTNGRDAEIIFIAPRSGSFNLVASNYYWADVGGYRLTMQECPVTAMLDTAGTYASIPFPTSTTCVRNDLAGSNNVSAVAVLGVPVEMFETVDLTVTAPGFATAVEIGGPAFDTYAGARDDTDFNDTNIEPSVLPMTNAGDQGIYTLLVGASTGAPTGNFSVQLSRSTPAIRTGLVQPGSGGPKAMGGVGGKQPRP
jgi:hypothetical protein